MGTTHDTSHSETHALAGAVVAVAGIARTQMMPHMYCLNTGTGTGTGTSQRVTTVAVQSVTCSTAAASVKTHAYYTLHTMYEDDDKVSSTASNIIVI